MSYCTQKSHRLKDREMEIRAAATSRREEVPAEKPPIEVNDAEKTALVVQRIAALLENPTEQSFPAAMASSSSNSHIAGQEEGVIDGRLLNNTWEMEIDQRQEPSTSNRELVLKEPTVHDCGA